MAIKNSSQKIRFITIGGINTAIDFSVLFLLKSLGLPVVPGNIISTSFAFCFSFVANKKYTFKTHDGNIKRELPLFIIITLFGLWVLQTLVIQVVSFLLLHSGLPESLILFIAKIFATITSLTWNYIWYSRVVFKPDQGDK